MTWGHPVNPVQKRIHFEWTGLTGCPRIKEIEEEMSQQEKMKLVGGMWKKLSEDSKEEYREQAKEVNKARVWDGERPRRPPFNPKVNKKNKGVDGGMCPP